MKKGANKKRRNIFHSVTNRALTGLIISLAMTLTAFEWTTEVTDWKSEVELELDYDDKTELILPPVRYRMENVRKPVQKKKANSDQLDIVKDFEEREKAEDEKKAEESLDQTKDPFENDQLFQEEIINEDIPHFRMEVFAHYDGCADLPDEELIECSKLEIMNRVKANFKVNSQLREVGGKQGAEVSILIDKKGEIASIEILQSSSNAMSTATIKAIESLPPMNPARQQGHNVAVRVVVPIVLWIK